MKFLTSLICFLLFYLFLISSCKQSTTINIRDFYFSQKLIKDGLVYEYHPVSNDSFPVEYWYYRMLDTDTATYLTSTYYDQNFIVRQVSNEEIVSNGSILFNHYLYEMDSTGIQYQIPAKIISGNVFPFEVRDSGGVFILNLKWIYQDEPEVSMTLVRNRQYAGKASYTFKNEALDCVAFDLKESIDHSDEGHLEVPAYGGVEYYAKGLGLVYYKKEINEQFILEYELKDTFSMKVLEERFRNTIGFNGGF